MDRLPDEERIKRGQKVDKKWLVMKLRSSKYLILLVGTIGFEPATSYFLVRIQFPYRLTISTLILSLTLCLARRYRSILSRVVA